MSTIPATRADGPRSLADRLIAPGLFLAWLANDLEELATMHEDSKDAMRLASRVLPIPAAVRERGISQSHIELGIAMMGGLMLAASADGVRTGGRGRVFQTALFGFGIHGFGHLAQAAAMRRWTTGARTSPTFVIPYWLLASWALRRRGVDPTERVSWPFVIGMPAFLLAVHGAAWAIRRAMGVRRPLADEE